MLPMPYRIRRRGIIVIQNPAPNFSWDIYYWKRGSTPQLQHSYQYQVRYHERNLHKHFKSPFASVLLLDALLYHHRGGQCSDGREKACSGFARVLYEKLVHDYNGRHCLDNRDCARDDTWVMTTPCRQQARCSIVLCSFLGLRYGGWRLEADPTRNK